ncbi:MAG: cell division protein SepF [Eubacterium sp.]|nr:cell division protein SepF [Eubacterium sp.]MCM1304268.1 cell division protein SepF [Butyrivibrio sp.]MCM1345075.1 cell division protein SepF [Muribaculaceae bacterium]MCM1409663.1 cell division protein SepF [Lachnospiraceae bacterium]
MSVMDKFLNYMKLNGEEDDEYYDDEYLDDDEDLEPAPKKSGSSKARDMDAYEDSGTAKKPSAGNKITPISKPSSRRMNNGAGMEVCVIKPTSVEDAREITETLLANRTVVLNLEGLDVDIAQRIIDFTSGSCFAIGGNLQKISHYIFIITPASVDISGDFQDIFGGSFEMPLNNQ